jgi:photosystem II stability/assembly factor-like uncharacterized protein
MKGDFSRDIFDPARHYSSVLLEQGGLITDSDWKESEDIARHRRERADADIIGSCGAPIDAAAFALTPSFRARALALDAASPASIWIAGEDGFLLRSVDQGSTWSVIDAGQTAHLCALQFGGSGGWAVGEKGAVLRSEDAGTTWTSRDAGTKVVLRALALAGANRVWAVGDGGIVVLSSDSGDHWTRRVAASVQLNGVAFKDALNGIVVGNSGTICTSGDGGETWQVRTSGANANLRAVAFIGTTSAWAVGDDGAILHSADSGATWTAQNSGTTQHLTALDFASPTDGCAAGENGTVLTTLDGGVTWTAATTGVTSSVRCVRLNVSEALAATDEGELLRVPLAGAATAQALPHASLLIGAGRYYVSGMLCEVDEPVSYFNQPDRGPTARLAPGQHLVYVQVWSRHLSALEAEGIREVALGDADPSSRSKVIWQVRTLPLPVVSPPGWTCGSEAPAWSELTAPPSARLSARAEPQQQPANLCDVGAAAGFRRLENQLYRVEIQQGGAQPRFKWSRENGSVAFGIESIAAPSGTSPITTVVRLRSRGRDQTLDIAAGDRVEILNDDLVLERRVGPLFEVVGDGDDAMEIVLAGVAPTELAADPSRHPLLRRWDHQPAGADALEIVPDAWIVLEDGVEVRFGADGDYRPGDHWSIPARTVTGDVDWPRDGSGIPLALPPAGIADRYCRLGIIDVAPDGAISVLSDCRDLFPTLTGLTNLFYVGGDGQEVAPNPLNPQDAPLPAPLEVAVFNGQYPVEGAQVLFSVAQGVLPNGTKTQIVSTLADGSAAVAWSLDPFVRNQTANAQLLVGGATAVGKFNVIKFAARLSVADRVSYDPANCADLQALGVNNVQAAIDALCARAHGGGGCCVTVGEKGEFRTLDEALRKLVGRGERNICICLLPGNHSLAESIDVQHAGLKLAIHGSGRTSQLILEGQEFNFIDLDALQIAELDIIAMRGDAAMIRLVRCGDVALSSLHLAGMTRPRASLLQISGANRIQITASHLTAFQEAGLVRGATLLDRVPSLAALAPAMKPDEEGVFAPMSPRIAETFAGMNNTQRKKLVTELRRFVEQNDPEFQLSAEEIDAATTLQARLAAPDPLTMRIALDKLRAAFLLRRPGFALSLADADAITLVSDSQIDGCVSLYGEAGELDGVDRDLDPLSDLIKRGHVILGTARGDLRLRNNQLRQLRLSDELVRRLKEAIHGGGTVEGCFRSLIAESNELRGPDNQLLAFDMSMTGNALFPDQDVGMTIARQFKCLGNFAHNDFRLFNIGNIAEKFGNGGLNLIDL